MTFSLVEFISLLACALLLPALCHFDTVIRQRAIVQGWFLRRLVRGSLAPALLGTMLYLGFYHVVVQFSAATIIHGDLDITFLAVFALVCGFVSASVEAERRRFQPAIVRISNENSAR